MDKKYDTSSPKRQAVGSNPAGLTTLPDFARISSKSPGAKSAKETIFALKNGIFRRKNPPAPAVHAAGLD